MGTLGLLLSGHGGAEELPILEAALTNVVADAALRDGRLSGSLAAEAAANAYSVQQAGWEPVIEPWCFSMEGQTALPGCVLAVGCDPLLQDELCSKHYRHSSVLHI